MNARRFRIAWLMTIVAIGSAGKDMHRSPRSSSGIDRRCDRYARRTCCSSRAPTFCLAELSLPSHGNARRSEPFLCKWVRDVRVTRAQANGRRCSALSFRLSALSAPGSLPSGVKPWQSVRASFIRDHLPAHRIFGCKGGRFTAEIVSKHRSEHEIRSGLRRGDRPPGYTIIEMAQQLDIDIQWIYREIAKGRIEISTDLRCGCYLFPRTKATVARIKQLKLSKVRQVIFRKEHGDD